MESATDKFLVKFTHNDVYSLLTEFDIIMERLPDIGLPAFRELVLILEELYE